MPITLLTSVDVQILEYNQRIQRQNGVPRDFPVFVREGFSVKVIHFPAASTLPLCTAGGNDAWM